ncbi:restriction endonuclease subunit S [Streptomyces sp. SA15]|uniref:restriction endonuclease subunit S n=1 Tax=Streptomyces sp. SA15 TaxID=934019 RepID=UPI00117E12D4|nr:restriction endonuclease subunit S [Streptomyces sp. SA15]
MNDLPAGWRWLTPHEIAGEDRSSLVIGPFGSNLKTSDYTTEGVPLVFVRDIRNSSFSHPRAFVSAAKAEELSAHLVKPKDVLVTKMGDPPGDSVVYSGSGLAVITADCIRLRPAPDFHPSYIAYALQAPDARRQVAGITAGVAQLKVSLARFRGGVRIPVPPLPQQERIVEVLEEHLSRLDAGVAYLQTVLRRVATYEDAIIMRALGSTETSTDGVQQILNGNLPQLAPRWEWKQLADVADVVGGVTKDTKKQTDPSYVEVPYLRVANVQRARLDLDNIAVLRVPPAKAKTLLLQHGDVLMNEGGDRDKLARGWVWEEQIEGCIHQNHVFRARPRPDMRSEWLAWCANTYGARWAQRHGKQSVNLASISLKVIKTMPIPVPPLSVQDERLAQIREMLERSRRLRSVVEGELKRAERLRKSLLSAAFSGRLVGDSGSTNAEVMDPLTEELPSPVREGVLF